MCPHTKTSEQPWQATVGGLPFLISISFCYLLGNRNCVFVESRFVFVEKQTNDLLEKEKLRQKHALPHDEWGDSVRTELYY
jgi:hypothetical protein